eukprot:2311535-Pleurochrysis_carterae.AAC.2
MGCASGLCAGQRLTRHTVPRAQSTVVGSSARSGEMWRRFASRMQARGRRRETSGTQAASPSSSPGARAGATPAPEHAAGCLGTGLARPAAPRTARTCLLADAHARVHGSPSESFISTDETESRPPTKISAPRLLGS